MFSLHILQAEEGDCVLLEYGRQANPHSALVDGGPSGTYENHIRPVLEEAGSRNGTLDVVVVSHIDSDHIAGVVSLFDAWLAARRADRSLGSMVAGALWHNAPRDAAGGPVEGRLRDVLGHARFGAGGLPSADMVLASIAEGQSLKFKALNAHVSRNERFKDRIICVDTAVPQSLAESVSIRVVGPTRTQLDRLFAEWDE